MGDDMVDIMPMGIICGKKTGHIGFIQDQVSAFTQFIRALSRFLALIDTF